MPDAFARLIRRMLKEGRVPWSGVGARARERLVSLFDAGVLRKVRRGGGFIVQVRDEDVLARFYRKHYPASDIPGDASPRAHAVGSLRNAKRAPHTDREPVLLRAFESINCRHGPNAVDLGETTRRTGAACLILAGDQFWSITAEVAVVENLECFLHFEALGVGAPVALYASGRLSNLVLRWLGSNAMGRARFVHCGDYDPVGLDEYLRLKEMVGDRARLHVPADLGKLVSQFGRPELLRDSSSTLQRLRKSEDAQVQRVISMLQETGCGLEQEALLLAKDQSPS